MPNPFSEERKPKPQKQALPCRPNRAHHWILEPRLEGSHAKEDVGRCRYCHRKKMFPATLSTYETWAVKVVAGKDPLPPRTNAGEAW